MSSVTSPQDSADSAGVLQLFLETFFMELLGEDSERSLNADQQQVKLNFLISVCKMPRPSSHCCDLTWQDSPILWWERLWR